MSANGNDRVDGMPPPQNGHDDRPSLTGGAAVIRSYLDRLPLTPGVYRMLNAKGEPLYVGKARSLRKRVSTYALAHRLPIRLQRMVSETRSMEFVTTHTEVEALLLESNLIKQLKPRYNVLLRDDKTFPDILIRTDHPYPQIEKHRGQRKEKGHYFGPFASAGAVNRTITALQKAFLLRNCSDSIFRSRTRPCLQYQIKRCSAPCVGYISEADYARTVEEARSFLEGRSNEVQSRLATEMEEAAEALEFERAARLRDRIRAMSAVQSHQGINVEGVAEADAIAAYSAGGQTCIQVFFFRGGRNYGNRAYFPSHDKNQSQAGVLSAFIGQFYENRTPPPVIMVGDLPAEHGLLAEALGVRAGRRIEITRPERGPKRELMAHVRTNAREALERRLAETTSQRNLLDLLADRLGLERGIERIEVYDNSHIQGTNAVGGMIVAGPEGFQKAAYRKFNIRQGGGSDTAEGGDDYAMMREVLTRRFARAIKEDPDRESGNWPDLVVIDGGKGQLSVAMEVLEELGISDEVQLLGVAKGPERNAGRERFYLPGKPSFMMEPRDPALYFIQRLRDEAHRFAIGSHRQKRGKDIQKSAIDEVPGIGAKRKKALLMHFGSAKAVARAGLKDLEAVEGISGAVAQKIYDYFHGNAS